MITYKNKNGKPMIRRCANCVFFSEIDGKSSKGYCKLKPLMFAYTHEETVFPIVRDFYLCHEHKFTNEEVLREVCEPVDLSSFIEQNRNNLKNEA